MSFFSTPAVYLGLDTYFGTVLCFSCANVVTFGPISTIPQCVQTQPLILFISSNEGSASGYCQYCAQKLPHACEKHERSQQISAKTKKIPKATKEQHKTIVFFCTLNSVQFGTIVHLAQRFLELYTKKLYTSRNQHQHGAISFSVHSIILSQCDQQKPSCNVISQYWEGPKPKISPAAPFWFQLNKLCQSWLDNSHGKICMK